MGIHFLPGMLGYTVEVDRCGEAPCPVDGQWLPWEQWSTCTATCERGVVLRHRRCMGPYFNGAQCPGRSYEVSDCDTEIECPDNRGTTYLYVQNDTDIPCPDNRGRTHCRVIS